MKLFLIKLLDWFDDNVLDHRFYWLCNKIAHSKWWGEEVEVDLTQEQFYNLALEAHRLNMTFNDFCVYLLKEYMKKSKDNS